MTASSDLNRIDRRSREQHRRRHGMRVHDSARTLAQIKRVRIEKETTT